MRIASGTVISGQIILDGEPLPNGALVTVLAREADETFEKVLERIRIGR